MWQMLLGPKSVDEDARRREYILNIILAGSILMLAILGAVVLYDLQFSAMPSGTILSFEGFCVLPAFFIILYVLSRRGFFMAASYLLIGAYFLGNSYAAYRWGVNVPTALVGYALLIVIASILISARFAFVVSFATALVVLPLWYVQLHGATFLDAENFTVGDGVALVILYGLITLVAWLSNREIERSLTRARRSERELKEERDSLEVKVEERTRELRFAEAEKIDHLYRFAEFGQLASGLFHDLLNVLNVVSLRIEREGGAVADDARKTLAGAWSVQGEIERFKDAFRKQLGHDDAMELFSLTASIESILQFLAYQAKSEGITLGFELAPGKAKDAFEYFGSPLKFHQVVINLVSNAIEAGGKKVLIRMAREGKIDGADDIVLSVIDDGPGVPLELRQKIFDPFFTTKRGDRQGTGIGLAITKRIIENDLGGSIEVSENDAAGAIFTVRFPVVKSDERNGPIYNSSSDKGVSIGDQGGSAS